MERIAKIETKTENLVDIVNSINCKLDKVIETKADRSEVNTIKRYAISAVTTTLLLLLSIIGYLLTKGPSLYACGL